MSKRKPIPRKKKPTQAKKRTITHKKKRTVKTSRWYTSWWIKTAAACLMCLMVGILWYKHDLPSVDKLMSFEQKRSIVLQTEDGKIITTYGEVYGEYIPAHRMPRSVVDALIATEDRRFRYHFGVDPIGITRAMVVNLKRGKFVQGGSTITQQLAKNVFLTPEKNIKRKIQELMLSFWLEYKFTKNEILSLYLNRVYFGSGTYGIDAAAHKYFGKSTLDLTLKESAMLVGLLRAPSRYSPMNSIELAEKRANQVLMNMIKADMISPERAEIARRTPITLAGVTGELKSSRYFTDWVVDTIPDYTGHLKENLVVTTTLDLEMQAKAERALQSVLNMHGEKYKVDQGAIVVMTPRGEVKAMVGGRDYKQSQFNRATQALRQPGSSFKLFVYLAGIQAGYTPFSMVLDHPIVIDGWQPKNYNDLYRGRVTIQDAFAKSLNTAAVEVSETAGRKNVKRMAQKLGITTPIKSHPSIALGTSEVFLSELTGAYATLAGGGIKAEVGGIRTITDGGDRIIFDRKRDVDTVRVLPPNIVKLMNRLLIAVVQEGTGKKARITGLSMAGKTGTSQDYRDGWFIGYTNDLVVGVWMGNDDGSATEKVVGGGLPAMVWKKFMQEVMKGKTGASIPTGIEYDAEETLPWRKEEERRSFWDKILGE